jgi:hypothetical protein
LTRWPRSPAEERTRARRTAGPLLGLATLTLLARLLAPAFAPLSPSVAVTLDAAIIVLSGLALVPLVRTYGYELGVRTNPWGLALLPSAIAVLLLVGDLPSSLR